MKVSILLPSIRPQNLEKFYASALLASSNNDFEIIIPSPYNIPHLLMKTGRVTFLHSYANPTICVQLASILARGKYLYNCTDDGLLQEGAIDRAVELLETHSSENKNIVNMVYEEGVLDADTLKALPNHSSFHPPEYWLASTHPDLRMRGIDPTWKIAPHFFMYASYFRELGGLDCIFQYNNHALHDLIFRAQYKGSYIINLPFTAFKCSHMPNTTGDHAPIHFAQTGPDMRNFSLLYNSLGAAARKVDYDNWRKYPAIWSRRFNSNDLKLWT